MTVVDVISIIVPIYNIEKYLARSIESLIGQTYPHLEIILVNDGSKDQSLSICQEYAKKDKRIVIIDKVNEGVSIARNTGIEAATGKYIGFIDPDDWVEPDMYEKLYNQLKKWDAPVSLCNYFKDSKKRSSPKTFAFKDEVLRGEEVTQKLVNNMVGMPDLMPTNVVIMGCVWRGLFKKEFLDAHELRFSPGLTIMEDLVFMVQTLLKCECVAIEQGAYYHYVQNPSSALHTYNKRLWEDQIKVYHLLEQTFIEMGIEEEMQSRLDFRYIGMVLSAIKNETYMKKNSDLKDTVANIRQICQDEKLKFVLERVKPIQVPEKKVVTKQKNKRFIASYGESMMLSRKPKSKAKKVYTTERNAESRALERQARLMEAKRKSQAKKSLKKAKHFEVE